MMSQRANFRRFLCELGVECFKLRTFHLFFVCRHYLLIKKAI